LSLRLSKKEDAAKYVALHFDAQVDCTPKCRAAYVAAGLNIACLRLVHLPYLALVRRDGAAAFGYDSARGKGITMVRVHPLSAALAMGAASVIAAVSAFAQVAPAPMPVMVAAPATAPTTTASNGHYVKFDGITGEVVENAHQGWIEIASFQWAVTRAATAGAASRVPRNASPSSLTFTKRVDKASVLLQKASVEGTHFKTVVFDFMSKTKGEYYQVTLNDVLVSGFRLNSGSDRPSESITLNFAKVDVKYGKVDSQNNRSALQAVPAGFDVRLAVPDAK
jgi:type VI secretion system secreted protein Hcp